MATRPGSEAGADTGADEAPRGVEAHGRGRALLGARGLACLCLALVVVALYGINLDDYFRGDDFDLINSFYGKSPGYFVALLWSIESGEAWKSMGIDPELGIGFLRPLKIWLLKLDLELWGANPIGFHLTSTLAFVLLVVVAFRLLDLLFPDHLEASFLGAFTLAIHPAFASTVPFITAREETVSILFATWTALAHVRHRCGQGSALAVYVLFVLGLLTKESAIVGLALVGGYDLAHGHLRVRSRRELGQRIRFYLPFAAILVVYFCLRWIAFGNFIGGMGDDRYGSPSAFLWFHPTFFRWLFARPLFALREIPPAPLLAALGGLLLVLVLVLRRRRIPRSRLPDLLFVGPLWYLASAGVIYGSYFTGRHNGMLVVGVILFAAGLVACLMDVIAAQWRRPLAVAIGVVSVAAYLPPSYRQVRVADTASEIVALVRARIEEETAHLPPGSTVLIRNVPQIEAGPYFFGWGLLSALKKPFTETDLANRSTVINRRNIRLNEREVEIPEEYDLVIDFGRDQLAQWLLRAAREIEGG